MIKVDGVPGDEQNEITADVQVFLDRALEMVVGKKVTSVTCEPVSFPHLHHPLQGYRITVEGGANMVFIDPSLTGLATGQVEGNGDPNKEPLEGSQG